MRRPGQGTQLKDGRWRIALALRGEHGQKIVKYFEAPTLAEAKRKRETWLAQNGRLHLPSLSGTLSELFEIVRSRIWADSGADHRAAMDLYAKQWEQYAGRSNVADLTAPTLTRIHVAQCIGKSSSTISKHRLCIKQALAFAVSDLGWITTNPAEDIRSPKPTPTKLTYPPMTREEYERMLSLAAPHLVVFFRLMGECGMRPIEASRVKPSDLHVVSDRWLVRIPKSKTAAGIRSVPVTDELARLIEMIPDDPWPGIADPVDHMSKWWRQHSETRMYDLRGWRADEWRRAGIPDQLRTYLLGHTKTSFTQRVYEELSGADVLKMFGR